MTALIPCVLLPLAVAFAAEPDVNEYWIVDPVGFDGVTLVGMEVTTRLMSDVEDLWAEFIRRIETEITGVETRTAYGVILAWNEFNSTFTYMAAVESDMPDPLPEGMVRRELEPGSYAVFYFPSRMLADMGQYAWFTWLPQSQYVHGSGYDFEYYPADMWSTGDGDDEIMRLYVSIESE
jgi:predicted transcriptional regulator YdeE